MQRDLVREWREEYARRWLGIDFTPLSDTPFKASVKPILSEDPQIVRTMLSPGITFRDAELIKDGNDSFSLLTALTKNVYVTHHGCDLRLGLGDATLLHVCETGRVGSLEEFGFMAVLMPHGELATRVVRFDEAIARRVPQRFEALQLLRTYVCAAQKGGFSSESRQIIRQHIIDLAALAITPHGALGESNLGAVAGAHLHTVFDHIASHFSEPELSLSKVAQSMRISTRYLQRLLKTSGTSFTAHVTELRL